MLDSEFREESNRDYDRNGKQHYRSDEVRHGR